ncbi:MULTISPECIES: hypothetical protein [Ralstonia]|jgi:hypothetical protein|uniref:Transporter n=2 Tax=Pseudomonadota TaxID=1224 RepID=R0CPW6_RALPI|nr:MULTISPECIES: hypothetical protein [Ralstonia]MEA3271345.1 hypothetical protein [Pseudomonadota bacterium]ENZ78500.1 hypothetical protein OR214_01918 [Ralstonia pickettii OR214]MBL4777989.1 hypothetical protein [Ralstonia sp.]MCM3581036.1 hypothetical protein [Ralstonia pickettii]OYU22540.1 MAG: hypothetical protein CFE42_11570 [Ralstonia sp. PBBBR1]
MYGPSAFVCICAAALALAACGVSGPSRAHGIAGNRFFPGTLNFDDPAVADELSITAGAVKRPDDSGNVTDRAATISFARLLTPEVSIGFDTGFIRRDWGSMRQPGATGSDVVLKSRLYEDDLNETLVAGSLIYGLPHTGAKRLGANTSATIAPSLYIGQGFGALPDAWSWLRPFAITAGVSVAVPTGKTSGNLSYDPTTRQFNSVSTANVTAVHWGFALEYSTLYLTDRFVPGVLPKEEPLHQWIPLVEFAFDSPRGQRTRGTVNPGIAYVKDTWQVAAELVLPATHGSTRGVGATIQVLFFLDDFLPLLFGKPILAR